MEKRERKLSFTFENPNTTAAFEQLLRKILMEKLVSGQTQGTTV